MTDVIKKNGKKEVFEVDKIRKSIKKAFVDAGISISKTKDLIEKIAQDVVKTTKGKTEITSKAIKDKILDGLDNAKKIAADAWKRFDRKYKSDKENQ